MNRRSTHTFLAAVTVALTVLALAACGSSGASTASPQPPKTGAGTPATVGVANTGLGNILVDTQGRTLYLFKKDSGPASTCTGAGTPATVGVANTGLGNILVDTQGRTLYLFKKDSGPASTCTGACATFWPPLIAPGTPTSGTGANASLIGTTKRQDGAAQVTYNGHPVYLYSGDHNPGETNGQGVVAFGAGWFALSPSGSAVAGASPNTARGGGGGY